MSDDPKVSSSDVHATRSKDAPDNHVVQSSEVRDAELGASSADDALIPPTRDKSTRLGGIADPDSVMQVQGAGSPKAASISASGQIPETASGLNPDGRGICAVPNAQILPSQGGGQAVQLVYALGTLGHDFGTEARRDAFVQAMPSNNNNPSDAGQLMAYLQNNPWEAQSFIWTLNLDATPIYAIMPAGAFASNTYERLRLIINQQQNEGVEIVSIPGVIAGSVTLMSGQSVPAVVPAIQGMYSWNIKSLVEASLGPRPKEGKDTVAHDAHTRGLEGYLNRVYYDLRNLGLSPQDRALNFSATNAFQVAQVMSSTVKGNFELDTIQVEKSPVCRPDSDCYDVKLMFFDPELTTRARRVSRFTVDVSDVVPVTIGQVRTWPLR